VTKRKIVDFSAAVELIARMCCVREGGRVRAYETRDGGGGRRRGAKVSYRDRERAHRPPKALITVSIYKQCVASPLVVNTPRALDLELVRELGQRSTAW